MFAWLRKRGIEGPTDTKLALRAEPPPRVAEPRPLADVIAAVAVLQPKPLRGGFEIPGTEPGKLLRAFAADARRVTPDTLSFVTNQAEMVIDLAHALVPLFGPIGADFGSAGWLIVDGTRSVAEIRTELGDRYKVMLRSMMDAMAPIQAMIDQLMVPLRMPNKPDKPDKPDDPEHR